MENSLFVPLDLEGVLALRTDFVVIMILVIQLFNALMS